LLLHRPSGTVAGTVRLILPALDERPRPLPIKEAGDRTVWRRFGPPPTQQTAEISRFAISKSFRRRHGDGRHAEAGFARMSSVEASADRRLMPHITFGLRFWGSVSNIGSFT
jgi:N-acyl amino acid synthase of PEP-CTERM/exosortase system